MAYLRLVLTDPDMKTLKAAALAERLPTAAWARNALIKLAREVSPSQPASASRKVDARTQAKYDSLVANLAERGRTVPQWYEGQLRDKLLSASDRAHADKMLELFNAEKGE